MTLHTFHNKYARDLHSSLTNTESDFTPWILFNIYNIFNNTTSITGNVRDLHSSLTNTESDFTPNNFHWSFREDVIVSWTSLEKSTKKTQFEDQGSNAQSISWLAIGLSTKDMNVDELSW